MLVLEGNDRIVGNFANWWKIRFTQKFYSLFGAKGHLTLQYCGENFANSHKSSKFAKVSKVSRYTLPSCVTEREVTV